MDSNPKLRAIMRARSLINIFETESRWLRANSTNSVTQGSIARCLAYTQRYTVKLMRFLSIVIKFFSISLHPINNTLRYFKFST